MKKTLLMTTAVVAVFITTDAYSQATQTLIVNDKQTVTDQGDWEQSYLYQSIKVDQSGELEVNTSDIKGVQGITVNGKLTAKDSMLESGIDNTYGFVVADVNLTGANVTLTDSDLESTGNMTIKNTDLTVNTSELDEEGWGYGLWAMNNINFENSKTKLTKSYIGVGVDDIIINGGQYDLSEGKIISEQGNVNIKSGTININSGLNEISAYEKKVTVDKAVINVAKDATLEIAAKQTSLNTGGTINLDGTLKAGLSVGGTIGFKSDSAKIVGDVNMSKGGVMDIGLNNAVVDGKVNFASGSTLKLSVTDEGNGSLSANGITAQKSSKLALTVSKTMEIGDTANVTLFNTENIDNKFTNEISNARYKVSTQDGKNYTITYENTASDVAGDTGGSSANVSTAEAWDSVLSSSLSGITKAVADKLNDLSQNGQNKEYIEALTAIAPDATPAVVQTATENLNQVFGAVKTRLSKGSSYRGLSSGDATDSTGAMWAQGLFNKSELEDTFDSQTKGVAFGVEKNVAENTKVGIGYAYSQTEIDGLHRSTDVDTHTAFLYAEYKPSNWYLNAIATYGMSDYAENKNVSTVVVNADYDAQTYGLQLLSGYDMQVGGFGFTPETGLRYVHIEQDSYTDTAKQNVSSNNNDILTGIIGAKINKTIKLNNQAYITPEVRVAATYDMINDDASSVVTLANGSAYPVNGESLKKFGLEFGTAVTAQINDNFNFSLGYEGKFKKDYQDHTGLLNAKYNF